MFNLVKKKQLLLGKWLYFRG